jgi:hypothetical protein
MFRDRGSIANWRDRIVATERAIAAQKQSVLAAVGTHDSAGL